MTKLDLSEAELKLLDKFAGMALQGIMANSNTSFSTPTKNLASAAYDCAIEMIKEHKERIKKEIKKL